MVEGGLKKVRSETRIGIGLQRHEVTSSTFANLAACCWLRTTPLPCGAARRVGTAGRDGFAHF